ncbi:hypothetical protein F5148DRAFT_618681 [Russula earlei]|uniref:Uncharacterized protein n=1 Tax=Russula earlei TaxID=71964 RepID=A0ACC0UFC6_9AGAM|nr:hypothetical protein F5148DRAFT_618681 [Russula earlei]
MRDLTTTFSLQVTEGCLTAGPLTVSPYGEISPVAPRTFRLEASSPSQILPFKLPGQDVIRFTSATFRCTGTDPPDHGSFSKRSKTALEEAWRSAVNLAHEADALLNDGLPSNLSSYRCMIREDRAESSSSKPRASTNTPQKSYGLTSNAFSEEARAIGRWSPPASDPLLEVPGELVFSLYKRGRTEYWAARVEQYIPPKTPSIPPKYGVRFKDGSFGIVSRDMFYTSDEPEFYSCKLGRYVNDDDDDDDDEGSEVDSDDEYDPDKAGAADEPATRMPPPLPKDFRELSIQDQFAYTKPVIKAILDEDYPPAREQHLAFMQGGPSRHSLRRSATGKGDLTAREVSRLGKVLQRWVLGPIPLRQVSLPPSPPGLGDLEPESGASSRINIQFEDERQPGTSTSPNGISERKTSPSPQPYPPSLRASIAPSEYIRQIGSPSYEALSEGDKLQYCLLVLFHEATVQLLLWRSGERRSVELLSRDDEERLRLRGLEKSEERAWAEEIFRMRRVKTRTCDPEPPCNPEHTTDNVSSSGRTLRSRNRSHVR